MALDYTYQKKSIWSYKEFTFLLSASLLLGIGNKIYELLLPLIMYDLSNGSSIVITSMRTAELLPNLFFGIFVGVIVDRVNKKKWAIWMILLQALVLIGLFLMVKDGLYKPIIYYLLGFTLMTLNYGFFNTQVSLIKLSVPLNMLTSANAKFSFVETFVSIMGPVFLGFVLFFAEKADGILVTVILYSISFILIKSLSIQEVKNAGTRGSFWSDLLDGWNAFKENILLRTMTFYIIILNCTMTVVSTTVLIFGTTNLNMSQSSLSLILSAGGIGGLLGSVTVNWLRERYKLGIVFGLGIFLNAISYLGLFFTNDSWFFALSLLLNGYSTTIYIICAYTFRHEQTPVNLMGRIAGLTGTLFRTGMPIAMLLSGWMIKEWGASSVFISAAIINLLVFLFYKKSLLWNIK